MAVLPERFVAELDRYVDRTPADRDRFVDLLRVVSIAVVILWHWVLSITRWRDRALVMPNPIDVIPGGWLVTWLLQIMPLFFVVRGFANHAGWTSVRRDGGGAREFLRSRVRRLLVPTVGFVVVWAAFDGAMLLLWPGYRSMLAWGTIIITPFWFLAALLWVVLLVPVTMRLHEAGGVLTLTVMGGIVALVDVRSVVATREIDFSHMWPTTAVIGVVALLQTGLAMLVRPTLRAWLQRRRVWKLVIAVDAVILTVFLWHMTAKVAVIGAYEAFGFDLLSAPTFDWWLQRPLWLLAPAFLLVPFVAVFAPFELRERGD